MRSRQARPGAVLLASLAAAACGYPGGPSRLTVENRTTEDVAILTGFDSVPRLFVPACGQAVLELGAGAQAQPTPPPDAKIVEIAYQFPTNPEGPTVETFVITDERIVSWRGLPSQPPASLPPCVGSAPVHVK